MTCSCSRYSTSPRQFGQIRMSSNSLSRGISLLLSDQVQDFRRLLVEQLLRSRLHVETKQRLRVRRPYVEPPVLVLHGEAVEPVLPSVGVARGDLVDLPGLVRHGRVDLAGGEVAT